MASVENKRLCAVALPISYRCMDQMGHDERVVRFVLPIGATINMDGTAMFVSIASIFVAQLNAIPLAASDYVTVILLSSAASVAAASVPSAALVLMLIVLSAINVPSTDVAILYTVDWLVDRFRTTNNMLGDCYCAAIVEHLSKKELQAADQPIVVANGVAMTEVVTSPIANGTTPMANGTTPVTNGVIPMANGVTIAASNGTTGDRRSDERP